MSKLTMWVVEMHCDQRSDWGIAGCTADMFRYQYCENSELNILVVFAGYTKVMSSSTESAMPITSPCMMP
jgi:hypothetical protein